MPKPIISLIQHDERDGAPLYRQIYRQLREHIIRGALPRGARLPSARALAKDLKLSRNTIEGALAQLEAEGFLMRRVGAGTFVADTLPSLEAPPSRQLKQLASRLPGLSKRGRTIAELGASEIESNNTIGNCSTDVELFPVEHWNRLLARRARRGGVETLLPSSSAGTEPLRKAIAEYLRLARGVQCEANQVIVVSSTQQTIDLCARLLLEPGSVALMEEPGYPSAHAALRAAGVTVKGVPVDDEGLVVDAIPARSGAGLLYVTPSNQYPLGMAMSLRRRIELLRWASANGCYILEDDYDSEFHYEGRPLASMQGLDVGGLVVYAGTFNKVLFPGIRLAYMVAPPNLVDAFTAGRRLLDGYSSPLVQLTLADFISEGHFTTHLRTARQHYAARRDLLTALAPETLGPGVRLSPATTGLNIAAHFKAGTDDQRLARSVPYVPGNIILSPLSHYYLSSAPQPGLLLAFGAASLTGIRRTMEALGTKLRGRR
jgi:GntR family transcriptional regulator/MocR family aminotransferase